ncbi:unnamed protein product [Calypogeia fissa]
MVIDSKAIFSPTILKDKVALITGGGSGIGLEIATYYGKHGAKVAIMGRRKHVVEEAAESLNSQGINAVGISGDVRKKEDCVRAVETVMKELGRLDILINGAAGNFLTPAEDLSPNGFKTVIDIDTIGTFTMCHSALHCLKRGGPGKPADAIGVIINISTTIQYSAAWYQIHVSAAKAANDSMTRSLALEWGHDYGIRVNSIAPGPIDETPGMDKLAKKAGPSGESFSNIPLGKMGEKWDVAMAAIFLASDAGKYVTGAALAVDGGSWFGQPRHVSKEAVRQFSLEYEKSRKAALAAKSKL